MPLEPENKNTLTSLDTLTDIIRDTLNALAGERMSFALVAVPRKEPKSTSVIPAMISTNIRPEAVSDFLRLMSGVLDSAPADEITRTDVNTH